MDSYVGRDVAEPIVARELDELMDFNQWRYRWSPLGWIPASEWLLRNMDLRWPKKIGIGKIALHLPERIAGKSLLHNRVITSDAMEFTGGLGNLWDEDELSTLLNTARDMHFFDQHPELYYELQNKYNLGWQFRALAGVRKYWWLLPVFTVYAGGKQAKEEDEQRAQGK